MEENNITGSIEKIKFADGTEYFLQDNGAVTKIEAREVQDGSSKKIVLILKNHKGEQISEIEFYVSGGKSKDVDPPFLYRLTQNRDDAISIQQKDYTAVRKLPYNGSFTLSLRDRFFHIAMPKAYSITKIITSNQEPLYLDDDVNFSKQETIFWIDDKPVQTNIYSFHPVIRPESINITFTININ